MVPESQWISLLAAIVLMTEPCFADGPEISTDENTSAREIPPPPLIFIPPTEGTPSRRVGGGTRGIDTSSNLITLLVPDGGGLTTLDKPPLVWHLSEDFEGAIVVELEELSPGGWRVARSSEGRFRKGFHALDLGRSDVVLAPGRIYRWSVSAAEATTGQVVDAEASLVERVETRQLATGDPASDLRAAAAAGLWFDALVSVFSLTLSGQARLQESDALAALVISANIERSILSSD